MLDFYGLQRPPFRPAAAQMLQPPPLPLRMCEQKVSVPSSKHEQILAETYIHSSHHTGRAIAHRSTHKATCLARPSITRCGGGVVWFVWVGVVSLTLCITLHGATATGPLPDRFESRALGISGAVETSGFFGGGGGGAFVSSPPPSPPSSPHHQHQHQHHHTDHTDHTEHSARHEA